MEQQIKAQKKTPRRAIEFSTMITINQDVVPVPVGSGLGSTAASCEDAETSTGM